MKTKQLKWKKFKLALKHFWVWLIATCIPTIKHLMAEKEVRNALSDVRQHLADINLRKKNK